jgi:carbon storage regulator CsrA
MLVLTRKAGTTDKSKITITTPSGDEIIIAILGSGGGDVKVGIEAPKIYKVVRNELLNIVKVPEPSK